MNRIRPNRSLSLLLLLVMPLTGCLFRSRTVERRMSSAVLRNATQQELIKIVNAEDEKIHSLKATVDIATSVGGAKKGKVRDYREIRGWVLLREPSMLRMGGRLPLGVSTAFDMASDGQEFKLSIPPKNKFYIGKNELTKPSRNALENLRPQVIYDALLIHGIDPEKEISVLESGTEVVLDPKSKKEVDQPDYVLDVIRRGSRGWYLTRKIVFSRTDLQPRRQIIYDQTGDIASEVRYDGFKEFNGVQFPTVIQIWRPEEEYEITLVVVKLDLNPKLSDDQFTLQQPTGSQLVRLNGGNGSAELHARDGANASTPPQQ